MTQPAKGQEPSMEEILASIRRIISDEPVHKPASSETWRSEAFRPEIRNESSRPYHDERTISDLPRQNDAARPSSRGDTASQPRAPAPIASAARVDGFPSRMPGYAEPVSPSLRSTPPPLPEKEDMDPVLATLDMSHRLDAESAQPEPDLEEPEEAEETEAAQSMPSAVLAEVNEIADHSYRLETSVEALEKFQPPPPEPPAAERRRAEPARDRAHDRGHLNRHDGGDAAGERGLISAATSAAVDSAFNTLAQTVLVQNGRTLEDLVREMLRPMLKAWLDDNLPSLVERLVRAEIERVSRGRG